MNDTLGMWDASQPPAREPAMPVAAFYVGGRTPDVWQDNEVARIRSRWGLPIWVNIDPNADADAAAIAIIGWLTHHHWKPGTAVALDREDVDMAAFITHLDDRLVTAGWFLMDYQSKVAIPGQPVTSGGLWVPDWTGHPHMYPGARATQFASATMLGTDYDVSLIAADTPLHELNPVVSHPVTWAVIQADVPILGLGDRGPAVRRMQHLILAWSDIALAPFGVDGIFGPQTEAALRDFQRSHGITAGLGSCTGRTWELLITG